MPDQRSTRKTVRSVRVSIGVLCSVPGSDDRWSGRLEVSLVGGRLEVYSLALGGGDHWGAMLRWTSAILSIKDQEVALG